METRLSYGYAIWVNQYTSSLHGLDEPGRSSFASFLSVVVVGRRAFSFVTVVNLKYSVHPEDKSEAVRKSDDYSLDCSKEWNSGDDQLRLRWMIYLVVLADAAESVRDAIGFEYCLASSSGWTNIQCAPFEALYGRKCRSLVLWAEIRESSLTGLELVQETTDKVVLVKEKPKAARDHQKSYVDYRRKPLEFEVGDRVLLKVTPWKGVVRFGKKGKLAPRYVGPFEILERIGLIKVDKTLRFIKESVEIMDREIRKLKRKKIVLVKVRWNSKRGPEFTWEHEDQMRIKYPQLFVDRVVEPAS
ncbi:hypothetical protein Tco_0260880 [Tanacetum coccineum]